jgi:hypothetical protein
MENINTPWSSVGYLTMKRTYSRRLDETNPDSPTEDWQDVVNRVVTSANTQLGVGLTDDEKQRLARYMLSLKGTVAYNIKTWTSYHP